MIVGKQVVAELYDGVRVKGELAWADENYITLLKDSPEGEPGRVRLDLNTVKGLTDADPDFLVQARKGTELSDVELKIPMAAKTMVTKSKLGKKK